MRKLYYYVACSLDGFIADTDGGFEAFLQEGPHVADFLASYARFDTVLMGRKTYEVGLKMGVTNPYPTMQQLVFSRTLEASPDANVELVSTDAVERVASLKECAGKDIWLCGGAELATGLWAADLVDGLILKQNPIVLGTGISLFSSALGGVQLEPRSHHVYANGVVVSTHLRKPTGESRNCRG